MSSGAAVPVTIVASPYEATASFVPGCAFGPAAILEQLEAFAHDVLRPTCARLGEWTWVEAHERTLVDPAAMIRSVGRWVQDARAAGRFPVVVGGEHTMTAGALATIDDPAAVTVVQLDAHADLRDEYEGTPWNHACAMRRALEHGHPLVQIGIRSAVSTEIREVYGRDADGSTGLLVRRDDPPAVLLTRSALRSRGVAPALEIAGPRVYVTIDLDVLDPSCAPGVGTPEPDGLTFLELLDALDAVLEGRTLVGADVVELCPARDDGRTARLAARLVEHLGARGAAG
jgi:agmatinase